MFDSLAASELRQHASDLPNLTALKQAGLYFANAHAPSPESGPARASLFTGLDPAAHGVWTDGVALPAHEVTLPERFTAAGYHSWLVGRRQLSSLANWTTEHARAGEYRYFDWAHGPLHRSRQNAYLIWLQQTAPDRYDTIFPTQPNADNTEIPAQQRAAMKGLPDELSFNAWVGEQALKRMSAQSEAAPFFGIVSFVTGEMMGAPSGSGPSIEQLDPRALIQADQAIGKLIAASARLSPTIIAATAARGSHASLKDACMRQGAMHVPLCLHGTDASGRIIEGSVSTMDLAPTLYEMANVTPPPRLQGRSLLKDASRGWALSRLRHPDVAAQTALICDMWKLVVTHGDTSEAGQALYHLGDDPTEANDLSNAAEYQDRLDQMLDLMIDSRVALEDRTEPRIAMF